MPLCIVGHDGKELLLVNFAVLVEVKLVDHRLPGSRSGQRCARSASHVTLSPAVCQMQEVENEEQYSQLLVLEPIPDFLRDPPEIPEADLPSVVVVKELERPADFLHRIACEDPLAH